MCGLRESMATGGVFRADNRSVISSTFNFSNTLYSFIPLHDLRCYQFVESTDGFPHSVA